MMGVSRFYVRWVVMAASILLVMTACACAERYKGTIAVKGNHPHTVVVLVTEKGDMIIRGSFAETLKACCQGRMVTLEGRIVSRGAFGIPPELEVTEFLSGGE